MKKPQMMYPCVMQYFFAENILQAETTPKKIPN